MSVCNTQSIDGETDRICEEGFGSLRHQNGVWYIKYKVDAVTVMVKIEKARASVRRAGEYGSEMHYELGKTTSFLYNTPYGSIDMELATNKIQYDLTEQGGVVRLGYSIKSGMGSIENNMEIKIDSKKE